MEYQVSTAPRAMTILTKRVVKWSVLLLAAAWVGCDWVTVGPNVGGSIPPWAPNGIRATLLVLATACCASVAIVSRRPQGNARSAARWTAFAAFALMWASCAYTLWRCYLMSTHNAGTFWFSAGWVLELAVTSVTMILWNHRRLKS